MLLAVSSVNKYKTASFPKKYFLDLTYDAQG